MMFWAVIGRNRADTTGATAYDRKASVREFIASTRRDQIASTRRNEIASTRRDERTAVMRDDLSAPNAMMSEASNSTSPPSPPDTNRLRPARLLRSRKW